MPNKTESYDRQSAVKLKKTADSMGYRGLVRQLSPVTIVMSALILMFSFLMGLGWQVWKSYLDHKASLERVFPIQAFKDQIVHFDEVLTMSASMAAATGDQQWEKRYRQFEPQLDVAIKRLKKLASETFDNAAAKQTDEANIKLVAMENQVFELVGQGQRGYVRCIRWSMNQKIKRWRCRYEGQEQETDALNNLGFTEMW